MENLKRKLDEKHFIYLRIEDDGYIVLAKMKNNSDYLGEYYFDKDKYYDDFIKCVQEYEDSSDNSSKLALRKAVDKHLSRSGKPIDVIFKHLTADEQNRVMSYK